MQNVKDYITEQSESVTMAHELVKHSQELELFYVALQPLFRRLETACGYKDGDEVNSWEFIEKACKWIDDIDPTLGQTKE